MFRRNNKRKDSKYSKRGNKSKGYGVKDATLVKVPSAHSSDQLVPDRFMTWLDISNNAFIAAGQAFGRYGFGLNIITLPFSQNGGNSVFPNLSVVAGTAQPNGLKNLLYNSGTSTGLYNFYRVWKVHVSVTAVPLGTHDSIVLVANPINANGDYGSCTTAMQGPNAKVIVATNSTPKTVSSSYDVPALMGILKSDYASLTPNTTGSFATTPASYLFCQITAQTVSNEDLAYNLGLVINIRYQVEFLQRADVVLLDS
jgi:hypothetical protein